MNKMPCRPPRQRVLIANTDDAAITTAAAAADDDDDDDAVCLPSITTDVDLSDHPLGTTITRVFIHVSM